MEFLLLKGFHPNARDRSLKTPLHLSAYYGHETVSDVLIKNGADLLAKDASGRTSFHYACGSTSP